MSENEEGVEIMKTSTGEHFDPSTYHARPGYLKVDDELMRVRTLGKPAERYNAETGTWVPFHDRVAVAHSNRLTEEQAHEMAKQDNIPLLDLAHARNPGT